MRPALGPNCFTLCHLVHATCCQRASQRTSTHCPELVSCVQKHVHSPFRSLCFLYEYGAEPNPYCDSSESLQHGCTIKSKHFPRGLAHDGCFRRVSSCTLFETPILRFTTTFSREMRLIKNLPSCIISPIRSWRSANEKRQSQISTQRSTSSAKLYAIGLHFTPGDLIR